jgi:hypothetical protein
MFAWKSAFVCEPQSRCRSGVVLGSEARAPGPLESYPSFRSELLAPEVGDKNGTAKEPIVAGEEDAAHGSWEVGDMATPGTWHRRGFAIVAATAVIGSLTIWATQVAITTAASAATAEASPYFAGAVTSPGLMYTGTHGHGKFYSESGKMTFVVPTVTCPASKVTSYAVFQYLQGAPGEDGFAAVYLDCESGTFSAQMGTFVDPSDGDPVSGGCAVVSVAAGDSITFSEQDSIDWYTDGGNFIPVGTIEIEAGDSTSEQASECSTGTGSMPDGPVDTGICNQTSQGGYPTGPVPSNAPPAPLFGSCTSSKVPALSPLALSDVQVDGKPILRWPTDEYDMYRYRQVGSTLEPIEQIQTQKVERTWDLTFVHR